jgi:hypothetical protein
MYRISLLLPLVLLAGCGGAYKVTVYGGTGRQYIAPDLCAAIIQCTQAKPTETACYYNSATQTYPDGRIIVDGCKEVK